MRCRARAAIIAAFWLLFSASPLLVSLQRVDPMACCRDDGKHRCFMRPRASARGPYLTTPKEVCGVATAKATSPHIAVLIAPAPRVQFARSIRVALLVVSASFIAPRSTRIPRAPPVA